MSRQRILKPVFLLLISGVLTACNAKSGSSQQVQLPEAGKPDEVLFEQRCHDCHVPPLPRDRLANAWPMIVLRMQSHRITTGLTPLSGDEIRRITDYLQRNAKDAT
jgi:predicted small secreted protein